MAEYSSEEEAQDMCNEKNRELEETEAKICPLLRDSCPLRKCRSWRGSIPIYIPKGCRLHSKDHQVMTEEKWAASEPYCANRIINGEKF